MPASTLSTSDAVTAVIEHSQEFLVDLPQKVYEADLALADAMKDWKAHRLTTKLAKAAVYKRERAKGQSQVDAQVIARQECEELSMEEIKLEADYYRYRAERDYLNGKLTTVCQLAKFHQSDQGG